MDFTQNIIEIIDDIELVNKYDKAIIKQRFLNEVSYYETKRDETKKYFNGFRFIVTSGSILLPAILSMGQMDPDKLPDNFDQVIYWATWMISLMVTGSNGFLQLFSLDKNYFSYSMVVEQLKTEGWQFFGLSGKYEDFESHQQAYKSFSKSIESIKRKQIEQEFSSGKSENKKKKFDFKGELNKFQKEHTEISEKNTPPSSSIIQNGILSKVNETISDKVNETISNKVNETISELESTSKELSESTEKVSEAVKKLDDKKS